MYCTSVHLYNLGSAMQSTVYAMMHIAQSKYWDLKKNE